MYQAAHTQKAQIKCIDIIVGDMSDDLKNKVKGKIPDGPTKTMGLYNSVSIAVGAIYDLKTNVSVTDGMTNGAECVIEKIDDRVKDSTRPSITWVSFPEASIGQNFRNEFAHLFTINVDRTWKPILEITKQFKISKQHQCQILHRQYPLQPAAAKTFHHCQGDTLNEAVLDLPSSTTEHMHYIALSRVTIGSTLHIINLNEKKTISQKVQEEMSIPFLYNQSSKMKLLFHNVRSLLLHFDDVARDYNVLAADWLVSNFLEMTLTQIVMSEVVMGWLCVINPI